MYTDKNKGTTLIEVLVSLMLILIMFQVISSYFKQINLEKISLDRKFYKNKNTRLIFMAMNTAVYESKNIMIFNLQGYESAINYENQILANGNALLIEKYVPGTERIEVEIYFNKRGKTLVSYSGFKLAENSAYFDFSSEEILIKDISIKFNKKDYGVLMEGFYRNAEFKNEFKK